MSALLYCSGGKNDDDAKALTGLPHTMIDSLLRFKFQKQKPSYFLGSAGAKPVRAPQAVDDAGRPLIEVCQSHPIAEPAGHDDT